MNKFAETVGWVVIVLSVMGAFDVGDFSLSFVPHGVKPSICQEVK